MDVFAGPILKLVVTVLDLYIWIVVIGVILNWLTALNVINTSNRFVYMISNFIFQITDPVQAQIRRVLPVMGGFDLSPIALILGLMLLQDVLINTIVKLAS